jgi:hypothetical protein
MTGRTILLPVVIAVTLATAVLGQSLHNLMLGAWLEADNGAYVEIANGGEISVEIVTHGAGTAHQTRRISKGTIEFGQCLQGGNVTVNLNKTECCYSADVVEGRMTWVLRDEIKGMCKRNIVFNATA